MGNKPDQLKTAIVVDWMMAPGGADRFLLSILKVLPNSTIFTALYNEEAYTDEFEIPVPVKTSFLQKLPFWKKLHRHYNILAPMAYESLDLREFDFVLTITAGPAKCAISNVYQSHVGIILTPPRYLWDEEANLKGLTLASLYKIASPFVRNYLRMTDQTAIIRIDELVSISKYIEKKVQKTYRRDSEVIYPGIRETCFNDPGEKNPEFPENYFFTVSRLYDHKRIDWAIKACKANDKNLVIVGEGPARKYLEKCIDGDERIQLLGWRDDEFVRNAMKYSEGFIFSATEDFGFVSIEAMATGCPVLGLNDGGTAETVVDGETGVLFDDYEDLEEKLATFKRLDFNENEVIKRAKLFTEDEFIKNFKNYLSKTLNG